MNNFNQDKHANHNHPPDFDDTICPIKTVFRDLTGMPNSASSLI